MVAETGDRKLTPIEAIFAYQESIYPLYSKIRFNKVPHMPGATQEEVDNFLAKYGNFETVPAHMWAVQHLWLSVRGISPALASCVDAQKVSALIAFHDVRETLKGDTTAIQSVIEGINPTAEERQDLVALTAILPPHLRDSVLEITDTFEEANNVEAPLEALIAKFLDQLQSAHYVLVVGQDFKYHKVNIEKVLHDRLYTSSGNLLQALMRESSFDRSHHYWEAAVEVASLVHYIWERYRKEEVPLPFQIPVALSGRVLGPAPTVVL